MLIGYARTSTLEQLAGLEAQERDLKAAGAEEIPSEQVSSVERRQGLENAISFSRRGVFTHGVASCDGLRAWSVEVRRGLARADEG